MIGNHCTRAVTRPSSGAWTRIQPTTVIPTIAAPMACSPEFVPCVNMIRPTITQDSVMQMVAATTPRKAFGAIGGTNTANIASSPTTAAAR